MHETPRFCPAPTPRQKRGASLFPGGQTVGEGEPPGWVVALPSLARKAPRRHPGRPPFKGKLPCRAQTELDRIPFFRLKIDPGVFVVSFAELAGDGAQPPFGGRGGELQRVQGTSPHLDRRAHRQALLDVQEGVAHEGAWDLRPPEHQDAIGKARRARGAFQGPLCRRSRRGSSRGRSLSSLRRGRLFLSRALLG